MAGRLRRLAPPAAFLAGLFLFGVSLLVLGTEATEDGTRELHPTSLTVTNGTAALVYHAGYFGQRTERIDVEYAFPQAPGEAYFLGCDGLGAVAEGRAPPAPLLAFTNLREGQFVVSQQTVPGRVYFTTINDDGRRVTCDPAVVIRWEAPEGDPGANRPEVTVMYHSARLDGETFALLAVLMAGSALLALLGGLAWARGRASEPRPLTAEDSTVEALRASLDRMGEQLERTRKNFLLAGVLGVFLWYPFLVPWTWQQAARSSDDPVVPWAVATLTLAFLVVLTVLWARESLRLDREVIAWRSRLGELRSREEHLMDTLDQGG